MIVAPRAAWRIGTGSPRPRFLSRSNFGRGMSMGRILLVIAVIAIGYDAIVHQGAYTRDLWYKAVGATERVVDEAKRVGQRAPDEPPRSPTN